MRGSERDAEQRVDGGTDLSGRRRVMTAVFQRVFGPTIQCGKGFRRIQIIGQILPHPRDHIGGVRTGLPLGVTRSEPAFPRLDPEVHDIHDDEQLVLDLLLLDESNPRSLAFQLAAIANHLESMPQASQGIALPEERRKILQLTTAVRLADVRGLASGDRMELAKMMDQMIRDLPELSNTIARRYFSLLEAKPQRLRTRLGNSP